MNVLALDIATHTGFCTKTASGVWDFSIKRDESSGFRLIRFKAKLKEICALEEINVIVFERNAGFHKNAIIVLGEMQGICKLFCEENKIEYRAYSASEIKKFATGKGNAKKDAMVKAANEKYGKHITDDNEADAVHIYHFATQDFNQQIF